MNRCYLVFIYNPFATKLFIYIRDIDIAGMAFPTDGRVPRVYVF
jgi:hypothetical protein